MIPEHTRVDDRVGTRLSSVSCLRPARPLRTQRPGSARPTAPLPCHAGPGASSWTRSPPGPHSPASLLPAPGTFSRGNRAPQRARRRRRGTWRANAGEIGHSGETCEQVPRKASLQPHFVTKHPVGRHSSRACARVGGTPTGRARAASRPCTDRSASRPCVPCASG
jgi:hypothetical protein